MRNTGRVLGPGFAVKRRLIEGTGGRALARLLVAARLCRTSAALLGAYDFAAADYAALMRGWLARVPAEGALLFCHPGAGTSADDADRRRARPRGRLFRRRRTFARDLAAADVVLGPVWRR